MAAQVLFDVSLLEQQQAHEITFDFAGQTVWLRLEPDAEPRPSGPSREALIAWLIEVIDE